jgi:hypothetical protein
METAHEPRPARRFTGQGGQVKYDDASWHYGGDYPSDLPIAAAGTHIGLFAAWAVLSGLASKEFLDDNAVSPLQERAVSPAAFFMAACDGKLCDDDLNEDGNAFARWYYDAYYFEDYADVLSADLPSIYHVADNWQSFQFVKPRLDQRLAQWRTTGDPTR